MGRGGGGGDKEEEGISKVNLLKSSKGATQAISRTRKNSTKIYKVRY
jgi:hypothetical protein